MNSKHIRQIVRQVANYYPSHMRAGQLADVPRIAYHIELLLSRIGERDTICDIGGGIGLFAPSCAAIGMKVFLIDDFNDEVNHRLGDEAFTAHARLGVNVVRRDAIAEPLGFAPGSFDAFTSFDSMEHWHHSPRRLFQEVVKCLKPDGVFLLGVPNCVNAKKRIAVPLGIGRWSHIAHWYDVPEFRGHVREPSVSDLRYIANDMKLSDVEVHGRNWLGYISPSKGIRAITPLIDRPLRMFPSLCADIYVIGRKNNS